MTPSLTSFRPLALALAAIAVLSVSAPFFSGSTHAQNTCDDPPFDTSALARIWDKTDFCTYADGVFDEIISGGVPRDGIPPIDNPEFESISVAAEQLEPQVPVIAVEIGGIARAYPLGVLTRHEIVNDHFGDLPVAITFCPLCNSAIVFERVVDGETLRFGVSGLLRNSDLIMWDDLTQSWWQQFTGTGIVGFYTDTQLTMLPSQVVSFAAFSAQYPDGEVLTDGRFADRNPYVGYDSNPAPFLFQGTVDDRLFPIERVLAGLIDGTPVAYPFPILNEQFVINDMVGDKAVVAFWQPGVTSALDENSISASRDVGMAALFNRELDGIILTFTVDEEDLIRDEQTGSAWNVFGTALDGSLAGSQLKQELAFPHFWFAWAAFRPDTILYGETR